uniref:SFRICE_025181 n=1 Tax=Spodoptera frugiperda TaxID=7108 RepID=A0A2H1VS58_SPOFR
MKVSEGFLVADSRNLPKADYIMLLQYMHENECYNIAETRSAKALLASREAYVDTAVGYVEVKREGNLCTVTAVIDESVEKIITVECNDTV